MKKISIIMLGAFTITSCNKIEETVTQTVTSAKEKAQQKTNELVQETVNEQLTKLVNAEAVTFSSVFPHQNSLVLENEVGKKVAFPNGTPFYVFKYKTNDKDLLLNTLVSQSTTNEAQSNKDFQKVDGASIVEKITFFEKFLPANTFDLSFLDDIKNDKSIEYYKVKRFPNASTVIYNPKTQMVYQFVEVKK
ncbi:hypothetical protein OK344_01630 [Kaistella sp. BT6-1-3]|uniref:Lipoprotein n=1 Tax=Kaistella yananensis TaxID=2989820 RepID=A0ABT3JJF8_9FLAO|nr:hypothetical protein [Kaistella yananensis]MCW4450907.1 hypothetical protein [Kaistella yananensis]